MAAEDLTPTRERRRTASWLALASFVALLATAGALVVLDDDRDADDSKTLSFAVPLDLDLPDEWTVVERDASFHRFTIGPTRGLPRSRIDFAIPEAATLDTAVADIEARAAPLVVLSDWFEAIVGDMAATCMEVLARRGDPGRTPLVEIRPDSTPASEEGALVLEAGAVGRICVVDAPSHPGQARSPLVVLLQAPDADSAAFIDDAEGVLADLES